MEGGGLKEEHAWPAQVGLAHPLVSVTAAASLLSGLAGFNLLTARACTSTCGQASALLPLAGQAASGDTRPQQCCHVARHMLALLQPQDAYGLEKLASEELARHYDKDFGIECRIAR